jgi:hypothetical protein
MTYRETPFSGTPFIEIAGYAPLFGSRGYDRLPGIDRFGVLLSSKRTFQSER